MELINHTIQWVKGEVLQGRIGFAAGILIALAFLYFADFEQSFYKGMILPMIILQLVLLGYSGFQMIMRPKHIEKVSQEIQLNPATVVNMELDKSKKDDRIFSIIRIVWAGLFVVSLILFFIFKSEFFKGMGLGFVVFFGIAFIFDSFLHYRLKTYLTALQQLS
jgi:hypothetical protein